MKEEASDQREFYIWIDQEDKIVTFCDADGFRKLAFRTQEDKMSYVYNLCESGYRIL